MKVTPWENYGPQFWLDIEWYRKQSESLGGCIVSACSRIVLRVKPAKEEGMALSAEEYIAKWTAQGEEDIVGENLTLNRGPAEPQNLAEMQATVPEGTHHVSDWGFGDDKQRIWFNPDVGFYAGYSELSHSMHIWRYPSKLTFIKHSKEVGEFFDAQPFEGYDDLVELISDPKAQSRTLDLPIKEIFTFNDKTFAEMVLGHIANITPRELQVELMMEKLAE